MGRFIGINTPDFKKPNMSVDDKFKATENAIFELNEGLMRSLNSIDEENFSASYSEANKGAAALAQKVALLEDAIASKTAKGETIETLRVGNYDWIIIKRSGGLMFDAFTGIYYENTSPISAGTTNGGFAAVVSIDPIKFPPNKGSLGCSVDVWATRPGMFFNGFYFTPPDGGMENFYFWSPSIDAFNATGFLIYAGVQFTGIYPT